MTNTGNLPNKIDHYAKKLNPYVEFPNQSGAGILRTHHIMRDSEFEDLYFVGTAQSSDGYLKLVYGTVPTTYLNSIPLLLMAAQSIYVEWDENGAVQFFSIN